LWLSVYGGAGFFPDRPKEGVVRKLKTLALVLASAVALGGCTLRDREWGSCAVAGAVVGGTVGGIAGGVTVQNAQGGDEVEDWERGAGIGGGIVGGALLGAILGHAICDPLKEAPPPPPPPAPPPPPPAPKKIAELKSAHFDFNKATLKPEGKSELDRAVEALKADPALKATIGGHTDSVGSDAYNMKLSERRANAARDYIVSQGIDASRITTQGFGESNPVASNDTAEGRAQNRRVEVHAQ
jgi:outer membrane protein OmpA-like peptidoglycan-associated protein